MIKVSKARVFQIMAAIFVVTICTMLFMSKTAFAATTKAIDLTVGQSKEITFSYNRELTVKGSSNVADVKLQQSGSNCKVKIIGNSVGSATYQLWDSVGNGSALDIKVSVSAPKVDTQEKSISVIRNAAVPMNFTYGGNLTHTVNNTNVTCSVARTGDTYNVVITGKNAGNSVVEFKDTYGSVVVRLNVKVEVPAERTENLELMVGDVRELAISYSGDGLSQNTTGSSVSARLDKSGSGYKLSISALRSGNSVIVVNDKNGNSVLRVTCQVSGYEQELSFAAGREFWFDSTTNKATSLACDNKNVYVSPKNGTRYTVLISEPGTYVLTYTSSSGKKLYYKVRMYKEMSIASGDTLQYNFSTSANCRMVGNNSNIRANLNKLGNYYILSFTPTGEATATYTVVDEKNEQVLELRISAYVKSGNINNAEAGETYTYSALSGYRLVSSDSSIAKVSGDEVTYLRRGSCKLYGYNANGVLAYIANVTVR